jgi:hypothetical protein
MAIRSATATFTDHNANTNHGAALLAAILGLTILADQLHRNDKTADCCGIAGVVGNPKTHSDARYVRVIGLD